MLHAPAPPHAALPCAPRLSQVGAAPRCFPPPKISRGPGRTPSPALSPAGCLNCSHVGELSARLATLEAQVTPPPPHPSMAMGTRGGISPSPAPSHPQVARLSMAEAPMSPMPKGDSLGRGPNTGQLWGSPAAQGSPGDEGKGGWLSHSPLHSVALVAAVPPSAGEMIPSEDAAPRRQTWFTGTPRPLRSQG